MDSWNEAVETTRSLMKPASQRWVGSPYEWMLPLSTKARGTAGEWMIEEWLTTEHQSVEPRQNRGHDLVINGRKVEIKTSMLDVAGRFNFLQVRTDRDYQDLLLLGLHPVGMANVWYMNGGTAMYRSEYMHSPISRAIKFSGTRVPEWLHAHGGKLSEALDLIKQVNA